MRCIELDHPSTLETMRFVERDPPQPGPGEVLVRVLASSLNFHDYLVAAGILPAAAGRVPLSDGVGEVLALGAGASRFRVGDRVMGTYFCDWADGPPDAAAVARMRGEQVDGFACEYVALPEGQFTLAPRHCSAAEAATLPCAGVTAWRALNVVAQVRAGDCVLVQGSGGVSVFALQFARMMGARVLALTSTEDKAERLRALGAEQVLNYRDTPAWGRLVRDASDGGVQHVVEVIGGNLTQTLEALRVGGTVCLVGALSRRPVEYPSLLAIKGNVRVASLTVGSRRDQQEMVRAIDTHRCRPVMDRSFALADLKHAFAHQAARAHFGKIGITVAD